jgi:preprotein translocase subunit SecD
LSGLQATLTLPGIAGIVLTLGMAVDANVLVFERIREEERNFKGLIAAVDAGYRRALVTIFDANITTLIAALILYYFGSGPVKGFAVTLAIGLVTSMFTAIMVTRLMVATWLRRRRPQALPI